MPTELVSPTGGQHLPSEFGRQLRLASQDIPAQVGSSFLIAPPTESRWQVWSSSTRAQHAPGAVAEGWPTMCGA